MSDADDPNGGRHAPGGIQALDAALSVLHALGAGAGPAALSDIARAVGMPASKVHRYLASFVHAGLARQSARSGRYELGPAAAALGLAALARNDFVSRAADGLAELSEETGATALLTVWGNGGATVIRWERAASPVVTSFGLGSTLPLLTSASGRVFLGFLPRAVTAAALGAELVRARRAAFATPDFAPTEAGVATLIGAVRAARGATVDGRYVPGLRAAAAPVTDWQGEAQLCVTLIGTDEAILDGDGTVRRRLAAFTAARSLPDPGAT